MTSTSDNTIVEFRNVTYRLPTNPKPIISDLNLTVHSGETLVLLGESGCGKTTTLKLVNRLYTPTEGDVMVEGKSTRQWEPINLRRHIGYVIQEVGLFPHFSVEENIGIVPRLEGWDADRIKARARALLTTVGLDPDLFAARFPAQLSGGQRQRVGVARALAADPPLILLDEPFGALDPITRRDIQQEFKTLQQRLQKTMVFVTHDVREALLLAHRIGLVKDGKLVLLGPPSDLLHSQDPEARAFAACVADGELSGSPV